eukprot:CAMPEP_0117067290 /NCGR_PEP_ID=MMETSP0472-20121206/47082_1 /TAXON_ID=693140 ORGANISM="Tiarina fusus, Strain LIS" /NCGR_SAMPLE_ID=MMETSP0472 /ASSEMBLY_ACC=CAM_ASM_000603 /LENGTH=99 /DNA_ID=CAMNT_0004788735 /DNA_START=121 /DNA_END=417 /DNA_ORIENTATION=+
METAEKKIQEVVAPVHVPDFLTIDVANPTSVTEPNGNTYTVYTITSKTNLESYPGEEFVVKRRYTEFRGLYAWLKSQEIPGLPTMPEKRFFDRFSANVV